MLIAGCSTVVDGNAVRAAGGPLPGTVDVTLLNPGNYPTKPLPPMGAAGTPATGAWLDAVRMADFVLGPWEVDPTLLTPSGFATSPGMMPLKTNALEAVVDDEVAKAGYRHNYVYGYASSRKVEGQKVFYNVVLRMADPESASAAAPEMAQATLDDPPDPVVPTVMAPMAIPGHADAKAVSHSYLNTTDNRTWNVVESFTAHGPYVLMQRASVTDTLGVAAELVARAIDLQGPRIDQFRPTDVAELPNLPRDPSGLLAKALPVPPKASNVNNNATFGAYAILHYMRDPVVAAKPLADAGVDVAVQGNAWIARARDAAGATAWAEGALKDATGKPVDPVPNLPSSSCLKSEGDAGFWCVATADRYEFDVWGQQLRDVHQRMAAQYILLTAK
ncbi:hypothetical protein [Mycobacterium sp. URHB0044]|uniref:DUF7373 family lipoprotein n=1 Tax=Mycobacterium sp. URHB0044 TaxID=1380386 RepID=UPI000A9C2E7E|nr:hypothetical protein [Mycobacterium sp. URHB0044]